jgi:hypothetical protein
LNLLDEQWRGFFGGRQGVARQEQFQMLAGGYPDFVASDKRALAN